MLLFSSLWYSKSIYKWDNSLHYLLLLRQSFSKFCTLSTICTVNYVLNVSLKEHLHVWKCSASCHLNIICTCIHAVHNAFSINYTWLHAVTWCHCSCNVYNHYLSVHTVERSVYICDNAVHIVSNDLLRGVCIRVKKSKFMAHCNFKDLCKCHTCWGRQKKYEPNWIGLYHPLYGVTNPK